MDSDDAIVGGIESIFVRDCNFECDGWLSSRRDCSVCDGFGIDGLIVGLFDL